MHAGKQESSSSPTSEHFKAKKRQKILVKMVVAAARSQP
jgi:hypothetical protein